MLSRLPKFLPATTFLGLVFVLTAGIGPAQQPLPQLPPPAVPFPTQPVQSAQPAPPEQADPNEPEVLARGPVHEAFATTAEMPVASPVVMKQPPDPIEELPPDEKPAGDNVLWIPGYWHWDDDADRFIWISGFWRAAPPGRLWVPGSWREVRGGWQWAPGFWQEPPPQQAVQPAQAQEPEIQYLPPPPATIEVGPTTPAVTATSFYVPGSWVWRGRYLWRPGFWIEHRRGWVWVPAHYRWSPLGYVFVDGYWDYPLASRGVLYAPMYFPRAVIARPAFVYTPAYVVSEPAMVGALFVRRGYGSYFFGDYFAPRYTNTGFTAWCGVVGSNGGFTVGFGVGRTWGYDPLFSYYSLSHRRDPAWAAGVGNLYGGRYTGTIARPPVNLVQQNTVINKITNVTNVTKVTNVTNNVTVVNKHMTVNNHNVTDVAMLAPAKVAKDLHPEAKIQPISAQVRKEEAAQARELRELAVQRKKLETAAIAARPMPKLNDPPAKGPVNVQPQTLKLEVPKAIVTKARVVDEKQAPPANPHRDPKAALKVDPKIDHKPDPHPVFTPKVNPKVEPKVEPKVNPKVEPKVEPKVIPKVEPKVNPKLEPKVEPKVIPKVEPKVIPKVEPKVEPKVIPKVEPKVIPRVEPKVEPKVIPKVEPQPKVEPKVLPKTPPKVEPPKVEPPKVEPRVFPRVETPRVEPLPRVDPRVNPRTEPRVEPRPTPRSEPKGEPKHEPKPLAVMPVTQAPPVRVRQPMATPLPVQPIRPVVKPVTPPQPAKQPVIHPPASHPKPAAPTNPRRNEHRKPN